jgi:hypothetical protein
VIFRRHRDDARVSKAASQELVVEIALALGAVSRSLPSDCSAT